MKECIRYIHIGFISIITSEITFRSLSNLQKLFRMIKMHKHIKYKLNCLKITLTIRIFRFTGVKEEVTELCNPLTPCAIIRHIFTKFDRHNSYNNWDLGVRTDSAIIPLFFMISGYKNAIAIYKCQVKRRSHFPTPHALLHINKALSPAPASFFSPPYM